MVEFVRTPYIADALVVQTTIENEILSWFCRRTSPNPAPSLRTLQKRFPLLNLKVVSYRVWRYMWDDEETYQCLTINPTADPCPEEELAAFIAYIEQYELEKVRIEQDARNRANVERQNREHRLASLEQCIERVRHRQKI